MIDSGTMTDEKFREKIESLTLEKLAVRRGNPIDGGIHAQIDAEIIRRTAHAQINAARYMLWSVIAIAITSGLSAFADIAGWLWPNPLHH